MVTPVEWTINRRERRTQHKGGEGASDTGMGGNKTNRRGREWVETRQRERDVDSREAEREAE